jgi:YegS/Rv2252/BmrU family lipid kinase
MRRIGHGELVAAWLAPDDPDSIKTLVMAGPNDGAILTRMALDAGYDTIVAVGGDGTLNDVIQELCRTENAVRLGLIPMGTANVLARVLALPIDDPLAAAAIVRVGDERRIDLGRCGDRWFALVVGVGFDGAVTLAVDPERKRRLGRLAYVMAAVRVVFRYSASQITLELDGGAVQTFPAYLVLIANGGRYAGSYRLGDEVLLDDGQFDLFVLQRHGPLLFCVIRHTIALLANRLNSAAGVMHLRAQQVSITSDRLVPVQADGDPIGLTPAVVEIAPARLRVLAPPANGGW